MLILLLHCLFLSEFIVLCEHVNHQHHFNPMVLTTTGPVKGKLEVYDNFLYHSYQGIPYAEAPLEHKRFLPPEPKKPWKNIFDATKVGVDCLQPTYYSEANMSEDCLHISVYVPFDKTKELPVMAFIHGDKVIYGDSSNSLHDLQMFLKKGIAVVRMNYRLGIFGFLSLGIEEASGNQALKDIILALKWTQANIKRFGGNPNNVTIFGNGVSASLAQLLTMTSKTKDLFHQAIYSSGSAFSFRFFKTDGVFTTMELAKELNLKTNDTNVILKTLWKGNIKELNKGLQKLADKDLRGAYRKFDPFVPCLEKNFTHAVITTHPMKIIANGLNHSVPVLTGFKKDGGSNPLLFLISNNRTLADLLDKKPELLIPSNIQYPYGSENSINLANTIAKFYLNSNKISEYNAGFIDFLNDVQFIFGILHWIKKYKKRTKSKPVYLYHLDFVKDLKFFEIFHKFKYNRTSNANELEYVSVNTTKAAEESRLKMSDTLLKFMTNFIKYGNPTPNNSDPWKEVDGKTLNHYYISDEGPKNRHFFPLKKRYQFWANIYHGYCKYLRRGGPIENRIV